MRTPILLVVALLVLAAGHAGGSTLTWTSRVLFAGLYVAAAVAAILERRRAVRVPPAPPGG